MQHPLAIVHTVLPPPKHASYCRNKHLDVHMLSLACPLFYAYPQTSPPSALKPQFICNMPKPLTYKFHCPPHYHQSLAKFFFSSSKCLLSLEKWHTCDEKLLDQSLKDKFQPKF